MSKYDWKQLEKEYILSDHKSVSNFLREKGINNNGTVRKHTSGWKTKKRQKEDKKTTKIIEKAIEKESEQEANKIVDLKSIANDLALNILKANSQLETYIVKSKKKTKIAKYDYQAGKPQLETIEEKEDIDTRDGIIDRQGLKQLTSALKDLNDILVNKEDNDKEKKIDQYLSKIEGVFKDD